MINRELCISNCSEQGPKSRPFLSPCPNSIIQLKERGFGGKFACRQRIKRKMGQSTGRKCNAYLYLQCRGFDISITNCSEIEIILKLYCISKLVFMTLVKNAVMQRKYLKAGRWGVVKLIEREFEKEGKDNQKSSVSKLLPSKIPREINILQSNVRICGPEAR